MANVNFFSPDGGTTRYPIEDTEARSRIETAKEQIYADNGVLGAKNILPITASTRTINGVTFTVNRNSSGEVESIVANGTATADAPLELNSPTYTDLYVLLNGTILTGCPSGGSTTTYELIYRIGNRSSDAFIGSINDRGNGAILRAVSDAEKANVRIMIHSGYTANNLTFKPMIRLASDPDDTYQPYAMTNRELTEVATQTEVVTLSRNTSNTTGADIKLFRYGKLRILTGFIAPTVEDTSQADEHPMLASNLSSNDTPQDFARGLLGRMGIIAGIVIVYADGKIQFTSSTTQNVYFNITWIAK